MYLSHGIVNNHQTSSSSSSLRKKSVTIEKISKIFGFTYYWNGEAATATKHTQIHIQRLKILTWGEKFVFFEMWDERREKLSPTRRHNYHFGSMKTTWRKLKFRSVRMRRKMCILIPFIFWYFSLSWSKKRVFSILKN